MAVYSVVAYAEDQPDTPLNLEKVGTVYQSPDTAFDKASALFMQHTFAPFAFERDYGSRLHKIEVHANGGMIFELVNHL